MEEESENKVSTLDKMLALSPIPIIGEKRCTNGRCITQIIPEKMPSVMNLWAQSLQEHLFT